MIRILLILSLLICLNAEAGQNVTGQLYVSGNTGLGTTSPTHRLSVNGSMKFTDLLYWNNQKTIEWDVSDLTNNNFFGYQSGIANTNGYSNNFIGFQSGMSNTDGGENNFIGRSAGKANVDGYNNNFIGSNTGLSNTNGSGNNFIGINAGKFNTEGLDNNYLGDSAGQENTTGDFNISIGHLAGKYYTTYDSNVFIGNQAGGGSLSLGSNNTFVGASAGYQNQGDLNIFIGDHAAPNHSTGSYNIAIGVNTEVMNGLTNGVALGRDAYVKGDNSMMIGGTGSGGSQTMNVGIGTHSPNKRFCVGSSCQGSIDSSGNIIGVGFTSSGNVGISTTKPNPTNVQITNGIITTWN